MVVLSAVYLIVLAAICSLRPALGGAFLSGFATTPGRHYLELLLRLLVGAAFLHHAPRMPFAAIFSLFGWTLILTTACVLVLPWHWHRRFARWAVPQALAWLPWVAAASLAFGVFVLACTWRGVQA